MAFVSAQIIQVLMLDIVVTLWYISTQSCPEIINIRSATTTDAFSGCT